MKTLENIESTIKSEKGRVKTDSDGKDKYNSKAEYDSRDKVCGSKIDSNKIGDNKVTEEKNY